MRIALQLRSIALGMSVMRFNEDGEWGMTEEDFVHLGWCAYSLTNEERRACIRVAANFDWNVVATTQYFADRIGLSTNMTKIHLQHLAAIGVFERGGDSNSLTWQIKDKKDYDLIRKLEGIVDNTEVVERERSSEEGFDDEVTDSAWDAVK